MKLIYESEKITSDDIRKALSETYKSPEWYLGFEIDNLINELMEMEGDAK